MSRSFHALYSLLLLQLLPLIARAAAQGVVVNVDPMNAVWIVHPTDAGYNARAPVAAALRDVASDWYKVMGRPPAPIVSAAAGAAALPPGFTGTAFFFGAAAAPFAPTAGLVGEAHALVMRPAGGQSAATLVAAVGATAGAPADTERAAVFALFAFAERVLGVEPLWWWTDTEPTYRGALALDPAAVAYASGTPTWRRRGVFPNDEARQQCAEHFSASNPRVLHSVSSVLTAPHCSAISTF